MYRKSWPSIQNLIKQNERKKQGYNYYPELDKCFKLMYFINQDWFKARGKLSRIQQKELFQIILKVIMPLEDLKNKLKELINEPKQNIPSAT